MPAIPLGTGAYRRDAGLQPPVELYNLLMEKDDSGASPDKFFRIQRPGLASYVTLGGPVNGLFKQDGVLNGQTFAIGGNALSIIGQGSSNPIGNVAGNGIASFAPLVNRIGIVRSPNAFLYDGTLVALALPEGRQAIDMDQLNGYGLFLTPTGRFYWLVPGATAIDPLDFANAESSPDGGRSIIRLNDEFMILGTDSEEFWQSTGDLDAPFIRAAGRTTSKGCLHKDTVKRFDNAVIWVGSDLSVYRTSNVPQDIGSPFISERLRKRTGNPSALVMKVDDHEVYVLRIPGQGSFAFDASTGQWSEFGSKDQTEWLPQVSHENVDLVGSAISGKVWRLNPNIATDDGEPFIRRVSGNVAIMGRPIENPSLSLGIGCSADITVKFRWSENGEAYPRFYDELEARNPIDVVNIYRLGQIRQAVRSFEFTFDEDAIVRISGASINEAFQ